MSIPLTEEEKIKVLNGDDLFRVMRRILLRENLIDQDREHFWVVGLASNNRILFIELISKGTVNRVPVEPMEVFSFALQKRAVKIILVHNHPSGELQPSEQDKDITDQLIQVGIIVNTPVVDHLIISTESYMSFANVGLLAMLQASLKYVPDYKIKQLIEKEKNAHAKDKVKNKMLEVAKQLLKEGMPIKKVIEITGLTKRVIEGLLT